MWYAGKDIHIVSIGYLQPTMIHCLISKTNVLDQIVVNRFFNSFILIKNKIKIECYKQKLI